jgi:hypothetical protein
MPGTPSPESYITSEDRIERDSPHPRRLAKRLAAVFYLYGDMNRAIFFSKIEWMHNVARFPFRGHEAYFSISNVFITDLLIARSKDFSFAVARRLRKVDLFPVPLLSDLHSLGP